MKNKSRLSPEARAFVKELRCADDIDNFIEKYTKDSEDITANKEIAWCLFNEAIQWRDAAVALESFRKKYFDSQISVCLCFSCELYLKAIWVIEKGNLSFIYKEKHKLLELFKGLSAEAQNEIRSEIKLDKNVFKDFDEWISFETFEDELSYVSNDFIDLRYEFEKYIFGENIIFLKAFLAKFNQNLEKTSRRMLG